MTAAGADVHSRPSHTPGETMAGAPTFMPPAALQTTGRSPPDQGPSPVRIAKPSAAAASAWKHAAGQAVTACAGRAANSTPSRTRPLIRQEDGCECAFRYHRLWTEDGNQSAGPVKTENQPWLDFGSRDVLRGCREGRVGQFDERAPHRGYRTTRTGLLGQGFRILRRSKSGLHHQVGDHGNAVFRFAHA